MTPTQEQIEEAKRLLKKFKGHTLIETNGNVIRFDDIIFAASLIAVSEQRDLDIKTISTHDEGEGQWCDTGEDMEWSCRSECVESALNRLAQQAFKSLTPKQ